MKVEAALITEDFTKTGELAAQLERQGFDGGFSFEGPHDPFLPLVAAPADASGSSSTPASRSPSRAIR